MEREKKRTWELIGIFLILGVLGLIVFFAQRSKMLEERDRLRLEDVKQVRVAMQEYYEAHAVFPEAITDVVPTDETYQYQCVKDAEGKCSNYELRFSLEYGTGLYGKGEYTVDSKSIILNK